METALQKLTKHLGEINDLESINALLEWDQTTYMPPQGATARGRQMATLSTVVHTKRTDPAIGKLLEKLETYESQLPYESDEASLIRVARRNYEQSSRIPSDFIAEFSNHMSDSYTAWLAAREANDFTVVQPYVEKTLELSRQRSAFFPDHEHMIDPLIDLSDYGMTAATIRSLFAELRHQLVPMVQAIREQPTTDDSCLHQDFPEDQQLAFGNAVAQQLGYDFERGRQDKTVHPFMTKFSLGDVRITTRVDEHYLSEGLFSTIHEAGHAMYEQGINIALEGTPLAEGTSSGVHESQSRLWENVIGRSESFWSHFYPKLQATFPTQLGGVPLTTFYHAINKVMCSLIRTDADEVTYNLHAMLRFDLEIELLEGTLSVADLPEAWNARYQSDLGVVPPDDRTGILQDIHWYMGYIGGAFQGYTIGNILSAQFFEAAQKAHPSITAEITQGEFGTLHNWLTTHIYTHGRKFTADEIVEHATGVPLSIEPYMHYLRSKYEKLYTL
ncbi:MAG: carboxypeptidase M32 [Chloroflexota bacterium]